MAIKAGKEINAETATPALEIFESSGLITAVKYQANIGGPQVAERAGCLD
jgi:hypothetical protein